MVLSLVLAACGGGNPSPSATNGTGGSGAPASSAPAVTGGTFTLPTTTEPASLDPNLATDSGSILVLNAIQRPLLWYDPKTLEAIPQGGLADSFEVSEDGTEITYTLKDGVKYSDGSEIVADDFVRSFKRLIDPHTASDYAYIVGDIKGASDLLALVPEEGKDFDDAAIDKALDALGVTAPDPKTVVIELAAPASYFPFVTTMWLTSPLKEGWTDAKDYTEAANYIASGPFKLDDWSHNESLTLTPNENWVGGDMPKVDEIDIRIFKDPDAAFAAYQADEIDMAPVPQANTAQMRAESPDEVLQGDTLATYYLGFDLKDKDGQVYKSKELRHALSEAIDRQGLIDTVRQGVGTAATSMVPKGMPGNQPDIGLKFDAAKAKADLETAMKDLGVSDVKDIPIELGFNSDSGHEEIMAYIQEQWRTNLGIEAKLTGVEWNTYLEQLGKDPYTVFRLGWSADYPHPQNFLGLLTCDSGNNDSGYCNPDYDALVKKANAAPDFETQIATYNEAQELLVDDAPVIFIYWYGRFTAVKPYVTLVSTGLDSTTGMTFPEMITVGDKAS
jgi:oligopeptide transport system substrate-binding protein